MMKFLNLVATKKNSQSIPGWAPQMDAEEQMVVPLEPRACSMLIKDPQYMVSINSYNL